MEDIWMYSIKNMHSLLSCPGKVIGTEIEDLFIKSELANMTVEQRKKYEVEIMTRNDILNSISEQLEDARAEAMKIGLEEGREKGKAIGKEEGKKEGKKEGKEDILRMLHSKGMSIEQISELTEIERDEVERIIGTTGK